jgi:hypothetical protein
MRQGSCWPIEATQPTLDLASTASRRLLDGAQEVVQCYFVFARQQPRRLDSNLQAPCNRHHVCPASGQQRLFEPMKLLRGQSASMLRTTH